MATKKKTIVDEIIEDQTPTRLLNYTGKNNFGSSLEVLTDTMEKRELIGKIQNNCLVFYNMGAVPVKTDEDTRIRIADFFSECARTQQIPTVEKLALALGVTRETLWKWESGKLLADTERSLIIKRAKDFLSSFDAELLLENKLNPVAYIFRAKNYYGMSDKQEYVLTPNSPLGENVNTNEIRERIGHLDDE